MRAAVLDAAATLFALRGIDAVSLRDVAAEANVNLTLIRRYVGSREDLVSAVFSHVSEQARGPLPSIRWRARGTDLTR